MGLKLNHRWPKHIDNTLLRKYQLIQTVRVFDDSSVLQKVKTRVLSITFMKYKSYVLLFLGNLNPRSLEGGEFKLTSLDFFSFKFLLLYRLSKALAQLFLVCEHIF